MKRPYLIAHRGGAGANHNKENSLQLIQETSRISRVDYIEIDLEKTRDEQIILFHDSKINNLPTNSYSKQEIEKHLQRKIFLLEDVLKEFQTSDKKLFIEIKETGYTEEVISQSLKYLSSERIIFGSFRKKVIKDIQAFDSSLCKALILFENRSWQELKQFFKIKEIANSVQADFVVLPFQMVRLGALRRFSTWELPVWVWGVNQQNEIIRALKDKRIEGIISDYPQRVSNLESVFLKNLKK